MFSGGACAGSVNLPPPDPLFAAVFAVIFPAVMFAVAFSREGLGLVAGEDFASHSFRVLQWLAAGVLVNSMALVPLLSFRARVGLIGSPLHLLEFPLYFLGFWWMLDAAGIVGAAITWTIRVTVDALVLVWMAQSPHLPAYGFRSTRSAIFRPGGASTGGTDRQRTGPRAGRFYLCNCVARSIVETLLCPHACAAGRMRSRRRT
jgi:hypothetical protein